MYESSKQRADAAGVPFTISVDDVREVWPVDGRCPALGIPLTFGQATVHDASPTLDRLNPEWGYEKGNIAVLSLAANRAKGGLRAEDLERIAAWMRGKGLA